MLADAPLIGFLATADPDAAIAFYRDRLGLRLTEDTPFAVVFDAGGTELRIQKVAQVVPPAGTALGWATEDIHALVRILVDRGVSFERFEGLDQDAAGIWAAPGGAGIAWFRDPDGNLLSLTEHG